MIDGLPSLWEAVNASGGRVKCVNLSGGRFDNNRFIRKDGWQKFWQNVESSDIDSLYLSGSVVEDSQENYFFSGMEQLTKLSFLGLSDTNLSAYLSNCWVEFCDAVKRSSIRSMDLSGSGLLREALQEIHVILNHNWNTRHRGEVPSLKDICRQMIFSSLAPDDTACPHDIPSQDTGCDLVTLRF